MKRSERNPVRFPEPTYPGDSFYREKFAAFPFWYRWFLRARSGFRSRSTAAAARAYHFLALKRRLVQTAGDSIDTSVSALLPGFHHRVRALQQRLQQIRPALHESTGSARGLLLREALQSTAPSIAEELHQTALLPEEDAADSTLTLEDAQQRTRTRMTRRLEEYFEDVRARVEPLWLSLRTLNVLERIDLSALLPVQGAGGDRTPLRVVLTEIQHLHQALELCHRHSSSQATEVAWEFAHRRIRAHPGPARAIWSEIGEFRTAVPLLDILRYGLKEPFLEVPLPTIKSDWWSPLRDRWIAEAVDKTAAQMMQRREQNLTSYVEDVYGVERSPDQWVPAQLYPRTVRYLLRLAAGELFHDCRRVVSQLVVDAEFKEGNTRKELQENAMQIDRSLEYIRKLFADPTERGSLADEARKVQHRAGNAQVGQSRLSGLYDRYRPEIRSAIERIIDGLLICGRVVSGTWEGRQREFHVRAIRGHGFSGAHEPKELLEIVSRNWYSLGSELRGLYELEEKIAAR